MTWTKIGFLGLSALIANPSPTKAETGNPLVGAWMVERFVNVPEGSKPDYPFGEKPVGSFIFTADGHFSFNVMRGPDREAVDSASTVEWTPSWYVSYFGSYHYNADSSWTAKVLGGNIPTYIGTEQRRSFRIDGDVMTISATYEDKGRTIRAERVLRRASTR